MGGAGDAVDLPDVARHWSPEARLWCRLIHIGQPVRARGIIPAKTIQHEPGDKIRRGFNAATAKRSRLTSDIWWRQKKRSTNVVPK
jgi:hypothetical protein